MIASLPRPCAVDWSHVFAKLPPPAKRYRRSWFGNLYDGDDDTRFAQVLAEVDPAQARTLRGQPLPVHYHALVQYCSARFPVAEYAIDYDVDPYDTIPVCSLGWDPWDQYVESPAVAVCLVAYRQLLEPYGDTTDQRRNDNVFHVEDFECLSGYRHVLPAELGERKSVPSSIKPPRGRAWRKPWHGLRDLYSWALSQTGYGILDISDAMLAEGAYEMPLWDADEIRSLTRQWEHAKPMYTRAETLRRWVDASPRKRLPLFARALIGDAVTLRSITLPKRSKR